MSRPDMEPGDRIAEMYEEERRASSPPDLEEILAFLAGELDEPTADAFRDRLAIFPEAARLAAELADPPAPDPEADLPVPDFDTVRSALVAEGILGSPAEDIEGAKDVDEVKDSGAVEVPNPASPTPISERWLTGSPGDRSPVADLWRWAAVALLAVNLGLVLLLTRAGGEDVGPSTDIATWTLESDQRLERNARTPSQVAAGSASTHVLRLPLGDRRDFSTFRIVLEEASGTELWSGSAQPLQDGSFVWQVPADFLAPGAYRLRLEGVDGERVEKLAVYPFVWEHSPIATP